MSREQINLEKGRIQAVQDPPGRGQRSHRAIFPASVTRPAVLGVAEQLNRRLRAHQSVLEQAAAAARVTQLTGPIIKTPIIKPTVAQHLGLLTKHIDRSLLIGSQIPKGWLTQLKLPVLTPGALKLPVFLPGLGVPADGFKDALDGLFKSWQFLADFGPAARRAIARAALWATLHARQAVLNGQDAELDAFIREWLDQQPLDWRREAVADVLLDTDWIPADLHVLDTETAPDLLEETKARAQARSRGYKLLAQTQIRGRSIAMLDKPYPGPAGNVITLLDAVPASAGADELLKDFEDERLIRVLRRLTADERRVALARAHGAPSWPEAAADAGLPPEYAERVRRKCARGRDEQRRRESARTTRTGPAEGTRLRVPPARRSIES